ncbi:hypothetical protein IFO70_16855 [Phormidium tenue FACHB-886]|nr:hypothetical protein [Phormidium tenue FACHB-886]
MSSSSHSQEEVFPDASQSWDLARLYADLEKIKRHSLSRTEKTCLRGLLCGVNPNDIATALHRQPQGLRVDLTRGLYRYVEALSKGKVKNWREIPALLEQSGYRQPPQLTLLEATPPLAQAVARQDWGEAPAVPLFYDRTADLRTLTRWISTDRCRLVGILGMGGIGKTALSVKLAQQIQGEFEAVVWRSLRDAPDLNDLLTTLLLFLLPLKSLPESVSDKLAQLMDCLREKRCLIVLDNVEALFQAGARSGTYRSGYEGYEILFQQIAQLAHQSCLVITSREKPLDLSLWQEQSLPVQVLHLRGLVASGGQKLLQSKGITGSAEEIQQLVQCYEGNPLALKMIATSIQTLMGGSLTDFFQQGVTVFNGIRRLLDQQIDRLSDLELQIMAWLAINREPVSLKTLQADLTPAPTTATLLEALESLQWRSLIEQATLRFTQQPVIMEYMTERLIEQLCEEIARAKGDDCKINLLQRYALMKATAKDYIRERQVRVIVEPLLQRTIDRLGTEANLVEHLHQILRHLRREPQTAGYAVGNLLNLFRWLRVDLKNTDFSRCPVWQAYLADVKLHRVNFAEAEFRQSVFAETFGGISCVAFNPDGKQLATSDTSGDVQVWDLGTGQQQVALQADTVWTWAVAFSPNGQVLASAGDDYAVKLWEIETGKSLRVLQGHSHTVNTIAFNPNGQLLASGGQDTTIRLWSTKTLTDPIVLEGHTGRVWSVGFSPDGQTLVSGSEDCTLKLWDVRTGNCVQTFVGHGDWIKSVAFSANGQWLASGSFDGTIRLWAIAIGECLNVWQAHQGCVTTVAFSRAPSGSMAAGSLASSSYDQTVKLWDVITATCLRTWQAHSSRVWSVAFSPTGEQLASGGDDHATRLWDVATGHCAKTWKGHTNGVLSLALSSDRTCLASGHEDQTIKLWHSQTGQFLRTLWGHTNRVWSVAFAPDSASSHRLASGSADRTIKLWDVQTGQYLTTLQGHTSWVWSVAFSPTGEQLASGSYDQTVRLWETGTGECLRTLSGHIAPVVGVSFSPDGQRLASSSFDTTIRLWDISSGECLQSLQGHQQSVWQIAFSPDGSQLASCSYDKTVKLWNTRTGECLCTFEGHTNPVVGLVFSPNGQQIASSSFDRTVKLWDVQTGRLIRSFAGHTKPVYSLVFEAIDPGSSPSLLSSSFDETIRFWDTDGTCRRILKVPRPYEGMTIARATGITEAQKATLLALGAIGDTSP